MSNTDNRIVLTIEEAAQRLGIGRTTMYALVKAGQIRTVTIGRLRRVPTFCLDEYVRDLLADPTPLDHAA
ncbi:helix-turn-helix domain-containing protein [Micromonospora sp.]|uniref:helix-turn-helix domain-containing protein n=1 Tax=Micromonospora sp. TaxID=1876 RepID=UPI003B3AD02D